MKYTLFFICTVSLALSSCQGSVSSDTHKNTGQVCEPGAVECRDESVQDLGWSLQPVSRINFLDNRYPAAEFVGLQNWINSGGYTSLSELQGQVVLIDFWTLGCPNCLHTLPYLSDIYQRYHADGLEIIGIHSPEFSYERKLEALQRSVQENNLLYPVVQDNDFQTWKAYKNRYWPAHYLIDRSGNVAFTQFGQGGYDTLEQAIQTLLDEPYEF